MRIQEPEMTETCRQRGISASAAEQAWQRLADGSSPWACLTRAYHLQQEAEAHRQRACQAQRNKDRQLLDQFLQDHARLKFYYYNANASGVGRKGPVLFNTLLALFQVFLHQTPSLCVCVCVCVCVCLCVCVCVCVFAHTQNQRDTHKQEGEVNSDTLIWHKRLGIDWLTVNECSRIADALRAGSALGRCPADPVAHVSTTSCDLVLAEDSIAGEVSNSHEPTNGEMGDADGCNGGWHQESQEIEDEALMEIAGRKYRQLMRFYRVMTRLDAALDAVNPPLQTVLTQLRLQERIRSDVVHKGRGWNLLNKKVRAVLSTRPR